MRGFGTVDVAIREVDCGCAYIARDTENEQVAVLVGSYRLDFVRTVTGSGLHERLQSAGNGDVVADFRLDTIHTAVLPTGRGCLH
jgi:hypothetical protein